uniref:NADH dehydrogenase [ubiquinone] 1 beta subcomplex subunit 3 n=1 Tax=Strigamia maritima TaxID=126957 RepID=T1J5I5_STRMM
MVASPHGKRPYEIPDWRKFKVEDSPELVRVQQMLAQKGLKDPWLRNEVWRYVPTRGTYWGNFGYYFGRGMLYGLIAAAATIAITEVTGLAKHHGDHGNGNGDSHHDKEEMSE